MRLLADIGGTNARFALCDTAASITARQTLPVAKHERFEDALATFCRAGTRDISEVAISAAGPVVDGGVNLTNANWVISEEAVHKVLPGTAVRIVNDLAAVAQALPTLTADEFEVLQPGQPPRVPAPLLAINLGTGFGAAVAVPAGPDWTVLATEAGHISLAGMDGEERRLFGGVRTVEEVFSGPGLRRAQQDADDANGFRGAYSRAFGRVAGDIVLTTGSWGGLYLCGGVLSRLEEHLDARSFIEGFAARQNPVAARLGTVPVRHITAPEPAFLGLSRT